MGLASMYPASRWSGDSSQQLGKLFELSVGMTDGEEWRLQISSTLGGCEDQLGRKLPVRSRLLAATYTAHELGAIFQGFKDGTRPHRHGLRS